MMPKQDFVFLHGGGQGGWVWDETITALAMTAAVPGVRPIALDVPGCGTKRDRFNDDPDNVSIARELAAEIERAGMRNVVLVGHSQAGQVMPFMARLRPDLIARLVYLACSMPLPGQTVIEMMRGAPPGGTRFGAGLRPMAGTQAARDRHAAMFCNDMPPDQAAGFLDRLGDDRWPAKTYAFRDWPTAAATGVPASYIVCLQDAVLPAEWQRVFAGRFGATRVLTIDAGHQAMISQPEALAKLLACETS